MDIFNIARKIKDLFFAVKDFFLSVSWLRLELILKMISLVVSLALFAGIIYVIFGLNLFDKLKRKIEIFIAPQQIPKKKLLKKWTKIEDRLKTGQEAELKLAVIEADKLLDEVLKRSSYFGRDLGSRLKKINSSQIANINDVWTAHKVRNNIVHDLDFKLTQLDAERSINAYKKALEELEAI